MRDSAFRSESAVEYFKGLVDGALANQHVHARELTAFYVVHLLVGFLRRSGEPDGEPLAPKLMLALDLGGCRQRATLKEVGDRSLFVSGFFSDSLGRKLVDVGYYVAIGGCAYGTLSRFETDVLSPVFTELAHNFGTFVDVLSEVSEQTTCACPQDLLRIYEKWIQTGSHRCAQLLLDRGVLPNASLRSGRVQ
jgi:hypothetical protein